MKQVAVGYIRISQPDEQPENQKQAIANYAREHDIDVLAYFIDYESGAKAPRERPKYKMMLEFCRDNNIRLILMYDLSRLSRSLEDGLLELKNLITEGYDFKFVSQQFLDYISDPMLKKKVIADFLWFAELYREDIRRRTKEALDRLKRQGVKLGRKEVPIPVDLVKKYLKQGFKKKTIYKLLIDAGYLVYYIKGYKRVLSYEHFLRRLKKLGLA